MIIDTWVSVGALLLTPGGLILAQGRSLRSEFKIDVVRDELRSELHGVRDEVKGDIGRLDDRVYALAAGLRPQVQEHGRGRHGSVGSVRSMTALRFHGPVLPDGEVRDVYVLGGRITFERQPGADAAVRGWIVPGLVDAHCHLGLGEDGAISVEETERTALEDRDAGALLIRDCGSPIDTAWIQEREDLPRLIRMGRHIARTKRYMKGYADEVEPTGLAEAVAREAERGDGWVKLVGDWISREEGDLRPSFSVDDFAEAIKVAHNHGAKVTAHCFGRDVLPGLIEHGIDCIEHGTGLTPDLVALAAEKGVAVVPTVMQTEKFPIFAEQGGSRFPAYSATMTDLYAQRRETIMNAFEAGVPLYAGSDGGGDRRHGNLAGEIRAMAEIGLPAAYALGAASWRARAWLDFSGIEEGASADFVVYDADPLVDLSVLARPSAVVLRGQVVRG